MRSLFYKCSWHFLRPNFSVVCFRQAILIRRAENGGPDLV